jgi:hypothetical protein
MLALQHRQKPIHINCNRHIYIYTIIYYLFIYIYTVWRYMWLILLPERQLVSHSRIWMVSNYVHGLLANLLNSLEMGINLLDQMSRGIHCTAKGFYLHVTLSEADWTWVNLKHSCRSASLKNCGWNWMVEYHHLRSPQHHLMAPGSGPLKKMFVFVRKGMGPESPCNPRILQGFIWQVGGKVLFAPRLRVRHVLPHLSLLQHEDRTTSHMVSRCRK